MKNKKFTIASILGFCFIIFLIGCGSDKVTISKEEYKKLKGDTIKPEYPKSVIIDGHTWEVTLGSDGHEYVDNNAHQEYICMHWIECKKCRSRWDR